MTFRGLLSARDGVYSLALCDELTPLSVQDGTNGQLADALARFSMDSAGPVFMEIRALPGAPDADVVAMDLLHASAVDESWGCRERFEEFAFKARGNEPGWSITVSPDELVLTAMSSPVPRRFPLTGAHRSGDDADFAGPGISLSLRRGVCIDTMNGEQFGWRAEAVVHGTIYQGCAVKGDL